MSKTTFRSRNIEPDRPIPIYHIDELNGLTDYTSVSRSITQMPTGMEKEEETEHHIRMAMEAQSQYGNVCNPVIPIPEVIKLDRIVVPFHRRFITPKNYIKQGLDFEENIQRYDADSEDEQWLSNNYSKFDKKLDKSDFEKSFDKLELILRYHPQDIRLNKPESILNLPPNTSSILFKYWQSKRQALSKPIFSLVPEVKTEQLDGASAPDPYVAFRKRFEKMQTRKNRKQDEAHFEKLFGTYLTLFKMEKLIKVSVNREKFKLLYQQTTQNLFKTRLALKDKNNKVLKNSFTRLYKNKTPGPFTVNSMIGTGILQHNFISMSKSLWRINNDFRPIIINKNLICNFIESMHIIKNTDIKAKDEKNAHEHSYKRRHDDSIIVQRSSANDLIRYRINRCGAFIQDIVPVIQSVHIFPIEEDLIARLRHKRGLFDSFKATKLPLMLPPSCNIENQVEEKLKDDSHNKLFSDPIFDAVSSASTPLKETDIFITEITESILTNISNPLLNGSDDQNLFT